MDSITKSRKTVRLLAYPALTLLMAAGCAQTPGTVPETDGGGDPSAAIAASAAGDDKVCRNIRPIGSRISERVCMTAEQWERTTEQDRQAIEDTQRNSATSVEGG